MNAKRLVLAPLLGLGFAGAIDAAEPMPGFAFDCRTGHMPRLVEYARVMDIPNGYLARQDRDRTRLQLLHRCHRDDAERLRVTRVPQADPSLTVEAIARR